MIYCNLLSIPANPPPAWPDTLQIALRRMEMDGGHTILSTSVVYHPGWVDVLVVSRRVV